MTCRNVNIKKTVLLCEVTWSCTFYPCSPNQPPSIFTGPPAARIYHFLCCMLFLVFVCLLAPVLDLFTDCSPVAKSVFLIKTKVNVLLILPALPLCSTFGFPHHQICHLINSKGIICWCKGSFNRPLKLYDFAECFVLCILSHLCFRPITGNSGHDCLIESYKYLLTQSPIIRLSERIFSLFQDSLNSLSKPREPNYLNLFREMWLTGALPNSSGVHGNRGEVRRGWDQREPETERTRGHVWKAQEVSPKCLYRWTDRHIQSNEY